MPRSFAPISESALLRTLLIASSEFGARLFRNHRGVHKLAQKDCKSCQRFGITLSVGLHNGAPDLVGWQSVVITPEMVGTRVAVFVGVEAKRPDGGVVSEDQERFLKALTEAGAVAGVVRSIPQLEALLMGPRAATTHQMSYLDNTASDG